MNNSSLSMNKFVGSSYNSTLNCQKIVEDYQYKKRVTTDIMSIGTCLETRDPS